MPARRACTVLERWVRASGRYHDKLTEMSAAPSVRNTQLHQSRQQKLEVCTIRSYALSVLEQLGMAIPLASTLVTF